MWGGNNQIHQLANYKNALPRRKMGNSYGLNKKMD